ncbi:MAG TPA: nuclear transport factor 2 family protein [Solirubrobacterales bacterium]|jgi:ketosteroid isomerase-like protein|nr:nuclear transport factor 2 family protein [Solirubrobacterales bacterium]
MSQENIDLVKRSIAAYNGPDFEGLREVSHADLQLDWSESLGLEAGIYQGIVEVLDFYENFLGTFEEVDLKPDRFIESGDSVVVPNTAHIRGRDGIETIARSTLVFEIRDRMIIRIRLYQETNDALEAVGLSPS